ncbi:hypothetical protein AAE02nite_47050 [Adhaeribacter aerolatus]|uniref:Uncharacterized protein n=1 Tax=Adhaeribacter aerolatus TaxID=670289 RepID=A0A512B523_9BACT|nr:hypothetical protein [Adhaeribacter aerolatus]GEO07041.1 hypothetical protein AAE02nite_47050 [Adhaeribacter aerolatus]
MKTKILSLATLLITLLSVVNVSAQNIHFVGTPCYDAATNTVSGKVAGLGNNASGLTITITGQYGCDNPAGNKPPAWQNFTINNIPLANSGKSGQYTFSATLGSLQRPCPNSNWEVVFRSFVAKVATTNLSSPVSMTCP